MQIVPATFDALAKGNVRPLSWQVRVSFDKSYNDTVNFFELDTSQLDGGDFLQATEAEALAIQRWDYYRYDNYSDKVQMVEWTREIEFPNSVSAAMADFVFENFNDYFTPYSGSPVSDYIIPKRPVRILSGFNNLNLPQFIGLTEEMPTIDRTNKTVSFHAIDFLAQLYAKPMNNIVAMENVSTDQVLAEIFQQFGLQPAQYDLPVGLNVIPYVFFDKGMNAGNAFRQLMQAEMGKLWLDETGVIRFEPRLNTNEVVVHRFDDSNVNAIKITSKDNIINKVVITSDIRKLMPYQKIYEKADSTGDTMVIKANSSLVFAAGLDDPALNIVLPTYGIATDLSWFTAVKTSDLSAVASGVSITGSVANANNFTMFFQNTNAFDVEVDAMELWGEPARIIDRIRFTKTETESVAIYDEKVMEIENNFIQSVEACEALAITILDSYAEFAGEIEMDVKGNPALQLSDVVFVSNKGYEGNYKIKKITNRIQGGRYTQIITARKIVLRDFFELDVDQLNSANVLTI